MSTPASTKAGNTAGFLFDTAAVCSGVKPFLSLALVSAPASTKVVMMAGLSFAPDAVCSGVKPSLFRALMSAPAFNKAVTTVGLSFDVAAIMERGQTVLTPRFDVTTGFHQGGYHFWVVIRCGRLMQRG